MSNSSVSNNISSVNSSVNSVVNNEVTKMFLTASSVKQFSAGSVVVISKSKYDGLKDSASLKGLKVECATNLSTNVLPDAQLQAITARGIAQSLPVYIGTKTIRVADCEYAFDFDGLRVAYSTKFNNSTREWEIDWKQVRPYSVLQFVVGNKVQIEEYVDSRVIMTLLMEQLKGCKAAWQTEGVLSLIKDRLFVETKGYGHVNVTTDLFGNKVNINTPEYHWEVNKVNVFGINAALQAGDAATLSFCKGKVTKNTFSIINNSVNGNVPVISDKQATKYFVVGAGAEAMGVYKVDDELISFNPLGNTNKGANRIAAGNSKGAQFADASFSSLVNVLGNGEKTATHGKVMQTVVALGLACVAEGEMITNAQGFAFSINKNIRVEVSTSTLGIKVGATYREVQEALVDIRSGLIESGQVNRVLAPGEAIEVAGTVIYRNHKEVYITLNGDVDIRVGRCGFGGKPSTVRFVISGVAHMAGKKNIKARGESVKATSVAATRETFQINNLDNSPNNEWEVLLHSESFKTVHKLIAMFANELALEDKAVEYSKGVLSVDGEAVSQYDFNAWILSKLETRVIRRLVCNEDLAAMKDGLLNTKPQSVEINGEYVELSGCVHLVEADENFTWVEQEVKVIVGFSHFQVEVCTADEWYGKSKAGVIEQYVFGTFHSKLAKAFAHKVEKGAECLKYIATSGDKYKVLSDEGLWVVNLDNAEERAKFLSKVVSACKAMKATNSGVKGMLQSLNSDIKQEGYHAIRLQFSMNNNVWCADVPVMGMLKFASFDEQGNPSNDFLETVGEPDVEGESAVEDAVSVVQNFTNLLSMIKTFKGDSLTKDVFVHYQAHLRGWLARVQTSKIASRLIKGEEMAHLKVVPSFTLGWTKHVYQDGRKASVPNLGFASDSPIWNDINVGDIVISTRMPFPTAVAFRAVVDESIDRTMVSVSPILMTFGNRGDFDGDSLYVMSPRKVAGVTGIGLAEEFNNSLWSLDGFNNAVSSTTGEAVEKGHYNPITETISDTFNSAELAKKFFTISSSKSSAEWGADLVNVHKVYSQFVGMAYSWAFDATVKLFESGKANDKEAVLSVLSRWISYEEDTLGGYSDRGYNAIVSFKEEVDEYSSQDRIPAWDGKSEGKATIRNIPSTSAWAKVLAAKGKPKPYSEPEFAVSCAAGLNQAKKVERGEAHPFSVDRLAIAALAIRRLTSKTQFRSDNNFFAVAHQWGAKTSRSSAIANLASTTPIKWNK